MLAEAMVLPLAWCRAMPTIAKHTFIYTIALRLFHFISFSLISVVFLCVLFFVPLRSLAPFAYRKASSKLLDLSVKVFARLCYRVIARDTVENKNESARNWREAMGSFESTGAEFE